MITEALDVTRRTTEDESRAKGAQLPDLKPHPPYALISCQIFRYIITFKKVV